MGFAAGASPIPQLPSPPTTPSDQGMLSALLRLSRELVVADLPPVLQRKNVVSVSRKGRLLAVVFEDLVREPFPGISRSVSICCREILVVLQRSKVLLAECSAWSRTRLLLQAPAVSNEFHELFLDLATLLDILPIADMEVGEDVRDLVLLLRRQCRRSSGAVDPAEESLRREVLDVVTGIEREVVPEAQRLEGIFERLGLVSSADCQDEIEHLEREISDKVSDGLTAAMIAVMGLLRYAKCVVFGASTPRSCSVGEFESAAATAEIAVPVDFRCPISLELMKDPVVVASGQTYDRESISQWIGSGHATCPKTGQPLEHTGVSPNRALRNLISKWCRQNHVPFEDAAEQGGGGEAAGGGGNKAATEAARMTATFLVEKLAAAGNDPARNRVVHELRQLAKAGAGNRALVAEAGALPLLVPLLRAADAGLQLNAVTAVFNLSILEENKRRIMHAGGAVEGVVHVLSGGATWEAKENAAATLLSLSTASHSYRRRLGRNPAAVRGLVELVRGAPVSGRRDGLAAILSFASDRENVGRLVEGGVVEAAMEAVADGELVGEAAAVIAAVAKRGGAEAVWSSEGSVKKLLKVLRRGSDWARESAAAALVLLCRREGEAAVADVVASPGIEWAIWELMQSGTARAKRKAAALGRICRRWLAAQEADDQQTHS